MLSPKYLEALPQPIMQLYSRLENEIIEDIAKRIASANFLTPTAEWRLYKAEQLRLSSKEITKRLARLTGKSGREIKKLYTAALKEALANDEKVYRAAEKAGYLTDASGKVKTYFGSIAFSNILKAGLQNTNGLMRNLCGSLAANANKLLSDELDLAFMKVASGAFSADEAVFSAVKTLGKAGLTVVNYTSGHKDKVDVAVRRAVLTGIGQAAGTAQLGLAAEMGCDLVEVTAHLGARPTHQVWQGRIFSISGTHPKYPAFRPSTGYGTGDGLCGWNCRHSFFPFFEGLSVPNGVPFTKEENDKVYRDTQKQRAYERAIRQSKRELAAIDGARGQTADNVTKARLDREFERKAVTLKRRERKLAEHLRNTGLFPDNSRVRVDGFGRSVSQKAVWANKKHQAGSPKPPTGGGSGGSAPQSQNMVFAGHRASDSSNVGVHKLAANSSGSDNQKVLDNNTNSSIILNREYRFSEDTSPAFREAFAVQYNRAVKIFGNITTIATVGVFRPPRKSEEYGEYSDNTFDLNIRYADMPNFLKIIAQVTEKFKESGKWSTASKFHVIRHEIGHAIVAQYRKSDPKWSDKLKRICDIYSKGDLIDRSTQGELLSIYGYSVADEFIAESIAEYLAGNPREIAKTVVNIILE